MATNNTKGTNIMNFNEYNDGFHKTVMQVDSEQIGALTDLLFESYKIGRMVFIIGNGGSGANASHFAQDLAKGTRLFLNQEKRIRALSLTDNVAFISALGNDDGYDTIFEQQLRTFARPGDMLIAISGSGNSPNIIKAIEWANENDITTIGMTGFDGGKLREINAYSVHVPLNDMCTVESIHSLISHYVIIELQSKISADLESNNVQFENMYMQKQIVV